MTDHPFQYTLGELKVAARNLPPTVPELIAEAEALYKQLESDPELTEQKITDALIAIGKKEYPHRHAYAELLVSAGESARVDIVLDHLEPNVKTKLADLLKSGAKLEEIVRSRLFEEQFTPEERYQISDGILESEEHMREEMEKVVTARKGDYDKLVKKWMTQLGLVEAQIAKLRELAAKDAKWKAEILDKARVFEQGFSIVEKDPELGEVEKEIEYWRGTLGMEA